MTSTDPALALAARMHVDIQAQADRWAEQMNLADQPDAVLAAYLDSEATCGKCKDTGRVAAAPGVDRMSPEADDRECNACGGA